MSPVSDRAPLTHTPYNSLVCAQFCLLENLIFFAPYLPPQFTYMIFHIFPCSKIYGKESRYNENLVTANILCQTLGPSLPIQAITLYDVK